MPDQIPIPPMPCPLGFMASLVTADDGSGLILAAVTNASGAHVVGLMDAATAQSVGRELLALGREAQTRLVTPPKRLVLPDNVKPITSQPVDPSTPTSGTYGPVDDSKPATGPESASAGEVELTLLPRRALEVE